jgi:transcriptional regulator with XRE-family HTH domain
MSWDIDYADVGKRIHQARKEQGLTQEQLAELVGVGREYIGRIENARRHAGVSILMTIGEKLGLDPLELLFGIRTDRDNYLVRETIDVFYRLAPIERRKVLNYAEKLELSGSSPPK